MTRSRPFLLLAASLLAVGCGILPTRDPDSIRSIRTDNVPHHLDLAQEQIQAGELRRAMDRLLAVRKIRGLDPQVRQRGSDLLQSCAELMIELYQGPEYDYGDLVYVYKLELPTRLRSRAGVLAAERMLADGARIKAFKQIKKVDRELPTHPERAKAGEVLARSGLSLIRDKRRYYIFFKYESKGMDALEYLVIQYPANPSCAEAFFELARVYEERDDIDYAIQRSEELLIYHPDSPFTVTAEARLPYLRLQRLERDDYDRFELEQAHSGVQRWLAKHEGHELEAWVRALGRACEARLAANDLILARYYKRIGNRFGTRIHAQRALAIAEAAALDDAVAEARALLAALPDGTETDEVLPVEEPESETVVEEEVFVEDPR